MKKFLKDLEKELKKLKISDEEIKEILADHEEMIDAALNDGVSEEELNAKFGDPEKVAKELKNDNLYRDRMVDNDKDYSEYVELKGYALFKEFSAVESTFSVAVNLVNEDIQFYVYDGDKIEVFAKGETEKYSSDFSGTEFVLKVEKTIKLFGFRNKSTKFIVRFPKSSTITELNYNNTSGDAYFYGVQALETKLNAVSGDFEITDYISKEMIINTVSGDAEVENIEATELKLRSVSGDFEMKNLKVTGELKLKSVSGDFEIVNAVAGPTNLDSVSGDLEGEEFYPSEISMKTISGDVNIKNADKDKGIRITGKKTMSGDINIIGTILQ